MRYQALIIGLMFLSLAQEVLAANETTVRVIVKYKATTLPVLQIQISKAVNLPLNSSKPIAGGAYVLTFNSQSLLHSAAKNVDATAIVLERLHKNPNVVYALKDRVGYFKPIPQPKLNDLKPTLLSHEAQWDQFSPPAGLMLESAAGRRDGAWAYTTGKAVEPVIVAVLDTGISLNPSLINNFVKDEKGNIWGWNFAANNADILDESGRYHGSHVAGIIAGYGDVMLGVGEHLKILPVKIPDSSGMFYESQVINAIYWAVGGNVPETPMNPYPAKVLNMSFGIDEQPNETINYCDKALQDALLYARHQGAVVAVAAGNDNRWEHYNAPAVCNGTIKVASTGPQGLRAYYSNYGPSISFAAPGGDLRYGKQGGILSTVNPGGGYQNSGFNFYQGTSMASPHAAGVAGLIFAIREGAITPEKVEQILYTTTHAFGQSNNSNNSCVGIKPCGHGILDAKNAIKAAIANFDVIFTAPTVTLLSLKACGRKDYQLKPNTHFLMSGKARWLQVKTACQEESNYAKPQLRKTKEGKIVAHYGAVTYRLDDSSFKYCQVIGFNGVGCNL